MKRILIAVAITTTTSCVRSELLELKELKAECKDLKNSVTELEAKSLGIETTKRIDKCTEQGWW